jgi:hypothetical protein
MDTASAEAATSHSPAPAGRPTYASVRPYAAPPATLGALTGPTGGLIELPVTLDWGPHRIYDLSDEAERRMMYERVICEAGSAEELARYLDGELVAELWHRLWLPMQVRALWHEHLPELSADPRAL